jgi:small subunit ribosomal protein S17e
MGRIKHQLIKRTTNNLMKEHKDEFKESFDENKKIVEKYTTVSNKKLRNKIAGYATKLTKKKEEE